MEKETDMEALARMVANGFSSIDKQFDELREDITEIRGDITEIREDITGMREDLKEVRKDVRETHARIDRIVMPTLDEHARRIKDLETQGA